MRRAAGLAGGSTGRRRISLRGYFLFVVLFSVVVPCLLLGGAGAAILLGFAGERVRAMDEVLMRFLADSTTSYLERSASILEYAAASEPDHADLERLLSTFADFDMIQRVDEKGVLRDLVPADAGLVGTVLSRQDYVRAPKPRGETTFSDAFISSYSGNPTVVIAVDAGRDFLYGFLSLKSLSARLERAGLPAWETGVVVDGAGVVIAHPDYARAVGRYVFDMEALRVAMRNGLPALLDIDSRPYEGRFVPFGNHGWLVGILRTSQSVYADLVSFLVAFVGALALSLATGLSLMLRGNIAALHGVAALINVADKVAAGQDPGIGLGEGRHYDELLRLSEALRTMYERVRERETDLRRAEELTRASLLEKEILLKEIHHRVKNNLQVISSILRLQSYQTEDEAVRGLFEECENRVQAMALIHEKLYRSESIASIAFAGYVESLVGVIWDGFDPAARGIKLVLEVSDLEMPTDTVVPCGLIVTELLTNCLKYAFPDRGGTITLSYEERGGQAVLAVADDGKGLPPGFDPATSKGLGLSLVTSLCSQLKGRLVVSGPPGARFAVEFPAPDRG
jgi:two-component sensor histidine kinase